MPRPRFLKLTADKRARILEAAEAEFARSGFEKASYNRIIERAELSKGAMYYYFDDKLDLYVTVLETVTEELLRAVGIDEAWAPEGELWDVLDNIATRGWHFASARPELGALLRSIQSFPVKARQEGRLGDLYGVWRSLVHRLLAYGHARGEVRADLPLALLVEVTLALDEAIDFWLLDNHHQLGERPSAEVMPIMLDLYRRILSP